MRGGVVALLLASLAACGGVAEADGTDGAEAFVRVINVEVQEVRRQSFVEQIHLTAVAQANQDVRVAAEESGVIRAILVEKGAHVAQGQALFRIDHAVLSAQVDQAKAAAQIAGETWDRRRALWEQDRVGSEILYLEARAVAEQTAANLRVMEERLARTTIRAPFAGILESREVEVGTMVSPGMNVARIVDLDPIKVAAGMPERYAADVSVGSRAAVSFDVLGGEAFETSIAYVGATVEALSRTFPIEVVLDNTEGMIKPQMIANMAVIRRSMEDAIVLPQDALVRVEGGYVVFVAADGDFGTVAAVRPIEVGPSQRDMVVVESGVEVGERLIVVGQKSVAAGDRVNIVGTRAP
jgi:RND family efflux transporter MFP subunit